MDSTDEKATPYVNALKIDERLQSLGITGTGGHFGNNLNDACTSLAHAWVHADGRNRRAMTAYGLDIFAGIASPDGKVDRDPKDVKTWEEIHNEHASLMVIKGYEPIFDMVWEEFQKGKVSKVYPVTLAQAVRLDQLKEAADQLIDTLECGPENSEASNKALQTLKDVVSGEKVFDAAIEIDSETEEKPVTSDPEGGAFVLEIHNQRKPHNENHQKH